jgi:hypothetical protein
MDHIRALSFKEITERYAVKYCTTNRHDDGALRVRILCEQECPVGFKELRKGTQHSIGSHSAADVIGLGRGRPREFLTHLLAYKRNPGLEDEYQQELMSARTNELTKGNEFEPFSQEVYTALTGNVCYNGCFMKLHIPTPQYAERESHLFEFNNNSSDRVVLKNPKLACVDLCSDLVQQAKTKPIERNLLEKKMLDLTEVAHGVEFKNPYYVPCSSMPPAHITQCMFQCWSLGVEFVDYLSTYFDNETLLLTDIYYARVHRNEPFIQEMKRRLVEFSLAYLHDNPEFITYEHDNDNMRSVLNDCKVNVLKSGNINDLDLGYLADVITKKPAKALLW